MPGFSARSRLEAWPIFSILNGSSVFQRRAYVQSLWSCTERLALLLSALQRVRAAVTEPRRTLIYEGAHFRDEHDERTAISAGREHTPFPSSQPGPAGKYLAGVPERGERSG